MEEPAISNIAIHLALLIVWTVLNGILGLKLYPPERDEQRDRTRKAVVWVVAVAVSLLVVTISGAISDRMFGDSQIANDHSLALAVLASLALSAFIAVLGFVINVARGGLREMTPLLLGYVLYLIPATAALFFAITT